MLRYFLAPTRETPPDTFIRLGNIIEQPHFADQPLNEVPLPIDKVTVNPEARRAKFSFGDTKTTTIGIWATFLMQILGVGGDVNTQISRGTTETWDCDTIKTISFEPSFAYIKKSVEATAVKQYIQERRHRPWDTKLYMITGIKIAYGAKGTISHARSKGIHLHLGVDATSLGAPMQAGPDIGVEKGRNVTQEIGDKDPFVLGFRIQRIKVSTKGRIRQERVEDGDMLGVDDDLEDGERVELVIDGLEDADADAEEFGIESSWTVDGEGDGKMTCALVEDD